LAADPRIPCPPPARAALLRLNERGIDAISLLKPVPASSPTLKPIATLLPVIKNLLIGGRMRFLLTLKVRFMLL